VSTGGANPRVVSLVPSVTETLTAWGLRPVACTRFCERPDLMAVGGTKNPDIAAIVALDPDLVVLNDEENRREDAEALVAAGLVIHTCSPRSAAGVAPALAALAAAVGLGGRTDLPLGVLPGGLEPLGLRAFVPIWRRPWMTLAADTYGASLLDSIGVAVVGAPASTADEVRTDADRYPVVSLDAVIDAGPDVVLAPSEPYSFKPFHLAVLAEVAPVVPVDGQDLFWWGVRTAAAGPRLRQAISVALEAR
jgi:ABC-type Fe3+-hydroxamate transport system substrate-binding protein